MSTIPPCAGRWDLFDSTEPHDHALAASLCAECPILTACRERLEHARMDALAGNKYGPQGTWAGMPVGETQVRAKVARLRAEEAMFTDDELRDGHRAHASGDRTPATLLKERIYQRRRKQRPVDNSKSSASHDRPSSVQWDVDTDRPGRSCTSMPGLANQKDTDRLMDIMPSRAHLRQA